MIMVLSILVMIIVGYSYVREGLFNALVMLIAVLFSGLVTFNFFESFAFILDPILQGTFLDKCEDFVCLIILFSVTLGILRAVTSNLCKLELDIQPNLNQFAGGFVGLVTGYFVAGFFVCAMQTMPLSEDFLGFVPRTIDEAPARRYLPPDRVWLAFVRHAGAYAFADEEIDPDADSRYDRFPTFDPAGTFELRYLRYRRFTESRDQIPYRGELNKEVGK